MLNEEELQKHTLNLFSGDYDKLRSMFPDVGAGAIIRRIVRAYLEQTEGKRPDDLKVEIDL